MPAELRSHRRLFLPRAWERAATVYLPKVSSHSTSSSIVRSKSSKEGLPSGFFKKSKREAVSFRIHSQENSHCSDPVEPGPGKKDSGVGETQAGPSVPSVTPWLPDSPFLPCCHIPAQGTTRTPSCLRNQVLLIWTALCDLPLPHLLLT